MNNYTRSVIFLSIFLIIVSALSFLQFLKELIKLVHDI